MASSETEMDSVETPTTGTEMGSVEMLTAGTGTGSAETPTTESEMDSVETPTTESEMDSVETPTTGSEMESVETPTTGTETDSAETPTTGTETDSAETPTTGTETDSAEALATGAETDSVETPTESELESDILDMPIEHTKGDKWRFAYDIMKTVVQWSKEITLSDSEEPPHENFLFTDAHNDEVLDFLQENERYLKKLVGESTKEHADWNYDDENYLYCKSKILEEFKPGLYEEKEFVRLCAGIAFIAIGNQSIEQNPSVITRALNELHSWMKEVLMPGGTLQYSNWE